MFTAKQNWNSSWNNLPKHPASRKTYFYIEFFVMKQILAIALALSFLSLSLFGQGDTEIDKSLMGESDPDAEALLDEISTKYQEMSSMSSDLTVTIEIPGEDEPTVKEGEIHIKGEKFVLKLNDQHIITDGEIVWITFEEESECQINYYEDTDESLSPNEIFTMYQGNFLSHFKISEVKDGVTYETIEMTPFDKEQPFFKVDVTINMSTKEITKSTIFEKSGVRYKYDFTNFDDAPGLKDNFFQVDEDDYEEVIDLREY